MKRLVVSALAGLLALSVLSGCGSKEKTSNIVRVACTNVQPTLDHTKGYDGWQIVRYGIGQTVVRYDNECNIVPWLCEFKDGVFTVTEGSKFSDGSLVTAKDIIASIEDSCAKNPRAKEMLKGASWKVLNDKQFEFKGVKDVLTEPVFSICKNGNVYTGGKIISHNSSKTIVSRGNATYEYNACNEAVVRGMAYKKGEVDVALDVPTAYYDKSVQEIKGLRTVRAFMNMRPGRALSDINCRKALVYGMNIEEWEKSLQGILKIGRSYSPVTKSSYTYDLAKAKKLLGDKKLTLDMYYCAGTRQEIQTIAESTQAAASKLGVQIKLNNVSYERLRDIAMKGHYDIILSSATNIQNGTVAGFFRMNFASDSSENTTGYSSKEFDNAKSLQEYQDIIDKDCLAIVYGYPVRNVVSKKPIGKLGPVDFYYPEF